MANVPYMDTLTLTNSNVAYNLYALLSAADPTLPRVAQALLIQSDFDNGSARVFVGDKKMQTNANSYGAELGIGWSWGVDSMGANLLILSDVYIMANVNATVVHVTVVTR